MHELIGLIDTYGVCDLVIDPIQLLALPASNQWQVLGSIEITWRDGRENCQCQQSFTIPVGMITDLASVPLRLQSVISPCGRIKEAAVMHDGLYQYRPLLKSGERIGRAQADYMLYYGCVNVGKMSPEEAWAVFAAVRIGGSLVWHAHDIEFKDR